MKGKEKNTDKTREIVAIACLGAAILLLFSFLSYNPGDLVNQSPPNPHPHNWIGPMGAAMGYAGFMVFGYAAYLIPLALGALAFFLFRLDAKASLTLEFLWAGLVIFCSACLSQLFFDSSNSHLGLPGAGGYVGIFIADSLKEYVTGHAGAVIVFGTGWLISVVLLTGFQPSVHGVTVLKNLWALFSPPKEKKAEAKPEPKTETKTKNPKSEQAKVPSRPLLAPELELKDYLTDRSQKSASAALKAEEKNAEKAAEKTSVKVALPSTEILPEPAAVPLVTERAPKAKKKAPAAPAPLVGDYVFPPIDLLNQPPPIDQRELVTDDLKKNAEILAATLAEFDIAVTVGEVQRGPVITRYDVYPAPGVKVEKITALQNNIGLAMKATHVRIQAPVPGKGCVGIEVPNAASAVVYLREIVESPEWQSHRFKIPLALGKDISGNSLIVDLAEMPHILIAGATGAGKTVCINSLITGLLYYSSPEDLRLVMVDPKIVEMQAYQKLPHLWMPIVTEAKKVPLALRKLMDEMEHRYRIFAKVGVRNIGGFNSRTIEPKPAASLDEGALEEEMKAPAEDIPVPAKMPYIVVLIDELADVMMVSGADVEMGIARLTQLARATGIHMVLSTQRPSVNVITGVIKANIPARVAFQVASKQDSRVILDANGADKLVGKGDMIYLPPGSSKLTRSQGTYVKDEEIHRVVEFIEKRCPPAFSPEQAEAARTELDTLESEEDEELVEKCLEVIRQSKRASTSMLQRRLSIGYNKAARIMDILEQRGIVGPENGAKPREILMDLDADFLDDKKS